MPGTIALVGGDEFRPHCEPLDRELLAASGGSEVVVLPTAAAFEHPSRAVETAAAHFATIGGSAVGCMVLGRPDALDEANARQVRESRFVYLGGGSPMHLKSVLKDTPVWSALLEVLANGGVVAGSSAGAMVLTDPMVDPRGGAFTIGLGLVSPLAVIPHHESWSPERSRRTLELAPADLPVAALDAGCAIVKDASGWRAVGAGTGSVSVHLGGHLADLSALPV